MAAVDTVLNTLQTHGLALLFPLAILEGPIVTVIAAYVARLGYLNIVAVYVVVVVADLVGDVVSSMIGRASHGAVPVLGPQAGLNEKRRAIFRAAFPRTRAPNDRHRQAHPFGRARGSSWPPAPSGCRSGPSCGTTSRHPAEKPVLRDHRLHARLCLCRDRFRASSRYRR